MFNEEIYGGNKMVDKRKLEDVIYLDSQRALMKSYTRDY